mmetsp:Transcript_16146/g.36950  ORF Transcript_16146/g.36950 Transcript_16146/m.36950 type:complete len:95 (+) Transcript_16146:450-734(+)
MKSFQASAVLAVHLWVAMATSSMAMDSSNSSESDHNDNNSSSSTSSINEYEKNETTKLGTIQCNSTSPHIHRSHGPCVYDILETHHVLLPFFHS